MKDIFSILFRDLLLSTIALLPGLITIITEFLIISYIQSSYQLGYSSFISLLLIPFVFIFYVFIFRLLLPQVKEGRFPMTLNKGFLAWAFNLALGRSIRIFQLQDLIYSSYLLKYLYWRAMGAKIAFGINSSMYINLVDLQLIEVGKGSMLGDEVQVGCHLIQGNNLYLKKVIIGKNSFVGINSKLGPGTKIGNNCIVGPWNLLMRQKIKDNTEVKPFTYFNKGHN